MKWAVIISGAFFVFGNIAWQYIDWKNFDEAKLFFVPLAVFLSAMLNYIAHNVKEKIPHLLVTWFLILSYGNIVKQVLYTEKNANGLALWIDYIFGALVTIGLFYKLIQWEIQKSQSGRK